MIKFSVFTKCVVTLQAKSYYHVNFQQLLFLAVIFLNYANKFAYKGGVDCFTVFEREELNVKM